MNDEKLIWEAYASSKPDSQWLDQGGIMHLNRLTKGTSLDKEHSLDIYLTDFFSKLEQISQQSAGYAGENPPEVSEIDYDEYLVDHGGFNMGYTEFRDFLKSSIDQYPTLKKFSKYLAAAPNAPQESLLEYLIKDAIIAYRSED